MRPWTRIPVVGGIGWVVYKMIGGSRRSSITHCMIRFMLGVVAPCSRCWESYANTVCTSWRRRRWWNSPNIILFGRWTLGQVSHWLCRCWLFTDWCNSRGNVSHGIVESKGESMKGSWGHEGWSRLCSNAGWVFWPVLRESVIEESEPDQIIPPSELCGNNRVYTATLLRVCTNPLIVHHTWSRWNYEDKGASEDCNKLNLESKPVMKIDDKGVTDTVGSTVIFLRGVQTENGCAPYSRWRAMKLHNDVFFFFSYVDVSVHC